MSSILRNLVIFTDEGDTLFIHHFDAQWQFGPEISMIQEYTTSLFLLAQQQALPQSILVFDDELLGFLHHGGLYYCIVANSFIEKQMLLSLLNKIAIAFQNRYGLLLTQFNGESTFFRGFIEYLYQKQIISPNQTKYNRYQKKNPLSYSELFHS
jgi:hypothetical protein